MIIDSLEDWEQVESKFPVTMMTARQDMKKETKIEFKKNYKNENKVNEEDLNKFYDEANYAALGCYNFITKDILINNLKKIKFLTNKSLLTILFQ